MSATHAVPAPAVKKGLTARRWWPTARRALSTAFLLLVATLIFNQARRIEWPLVGAALAEQPVGGLLLALALAAASHALYSTFDLFGRRYTHHKLPTRTVMGITFISYAFNLSLGSLIGGIAFRYRLYAKRGLSTGTITRIVSMSMLTNWLGYFFLGGLAFMLFPLALPDEWPIGEATLRSIGAALLAVALAYLCACVFARQRHWHVRKLRLTLPSARMAGLQLALSSVNWMLIAAIVYVLLEQRVAYPTVLAVLLIAAVAGVITHVPGGLGVLEAVFIALLPGNVPETELLAALLAYRAVYYLLPLALATTLHLVTAARFRARTNRTSALPGSASS